MKYLCICLVVLSLSPTVAADERRVRPLDPWATESFERVVDRSMLARALTSRLESSDLVVYIETLTVMPADLGGTTRFMTSAGGYRYVRISLRRGLEANERAAILGHELQHACELADSAANDLPAVRRLYEGLGHRVDRGEELFETRAALLAGQRVWLELRSRPAFAPGASAGKQEAPSRKDR
ncbi:MAG: hypothetical protein Q7R30_05125 [Acidobacteriota bacterium]|nr:hypothetical protein [Acidobacteriota bacterium]